MSIKMLTLALFKWNAVQMFFSVLNNHQRLVVKTSNYVISFYYSVLRV